jgi:hypothetical protein
MERAARRSSSHGRSSHMTYEQESQLRQVILRFVEAVADCGGSLPKIKLVKLLYLLDLEAWKQKGVLATSLDWQFFHYGPYTPTLEPVLERAEGVYFNRIQLHRGQTQQFADAARRLGHAKVPVENEVVYLYKPLQGLPNEPIADPFVASLADHIVQKWAAADTNAILSYVYATEPIAEGKRYAPLDWNLAPRNVGPFDSRARHFAISDDLRRSIEATWATWRDTGTDQWVPYEPEDWLFDDRWFAAVARMDADEGAAAAPVRITGTVPRARGLDA